ncbi:hypothetical protein SAMN05216382_1229 [Sphingomonas palmae]|uniref:Thioredoxin domain-containing protein n=2 Tax=Sphingomonas palmae TaxID=1855283 RepID=A0A1H7LFC0_9SPHN|nr:hypothetical protein SAMN05216382_1229 [Sphingomonas palmae]
MLAAALTWTMSVATGEPPASRPVRDDPRLPPRSVIVLVASWCAPCRGELLRLDTIAPVIGGRALRVLAIDDSAATARMLRVIDPARVWRPDTRVDHVRALLLARTAGLPFSVVSDGRGVVCAQENGGLDAHRAAALVQRCATP